MADNQEKTIIHVVSGFETRRNPNEHALEEYARHMGANLVVVGKGDKLTTDEVEQAVRRAKGEVLLVVDTHGVYKNGAHYIEASKYLDDDFTTCDLFKAIAKSSEGKSVECIFAPCQSMLPEEKFTTLGTDMESAELAVPMLPKGSSVMMLTNHGNKSHIGDTAMMFKAAKREGTPLKAEALFDVFLRDGLNTHTTDQPSIPKLFTADGKIHDPYRALKDRMKKPIGKRFDATEVQAIEAMNRLDLTEAMELINHNHIDPLLKETPVMRGDIFYVAHRFSPQAEGELHDIAYIQPLKDKNLDEVKRLTTQTPPSSTPLGRELRQHIVILAAEKGDDTFFRNTTVDLLKQGGRLRGDIDKLNNEQRSYYQQQLKAAQMAEQNRDNSSATPSEYQPMQGIKQQNSQKER